MNKPLPIGINGFGNLGRSLFRLAYFAKNIEVAAVGDNSDPKVLANLLNYDSVYHSFPENVEFKEGFLQAKGKKIPMRQTQTPGEIPWGELGVEVVVDATENYRTLDSLKGHLEGGAKRVIVTVPPSQEEKNMPYFIRGINDSEITADDQIISSGSATAHCLLPIVKILHDKFGIEKGYMTVARAFTSEQQLLDSPNPTPDVRLSRAAAQNIIPSRTWSPLAVEKLLPQLKDRFDGISMEVPVADGSVIDLVTLIKTDVRDEQINQAIRDASQTSYKGLIEYCKDPIVSTDVIGRIPSCVFDSLSTSVLDDYLVKTLTWYDNYWSYASRIIELAQKVRQTL